LNIEKILDLVSEKEVGILYLPDIYPAKELVQAFYDYKDSVKFDLVMLKRIQLLAKKRGVEIEY